MNTQEAATIIDAIVNSLSENPNQFQLTVNVSMTGMSATGQGGGIGALGIAQGSGTGIHASASMDDAKIQIAQRKGKNALNQEYQALLDTLSAMAQELRDESPDKSKISRLYELLKSEWVPDVITTVVGNLISLAFIR
jgi:hypothetical protein